jgi:hypothetical protein
LVRIDFSDCFDIAANRERYPEKVLFIQEWWSTLQREPGGPA